MYYVSYSIKYFISYSRKYSIRKSLSSVSAFDRVFYGVFCKVYIGGHRHIKNLELEVAELVFAWVSRAFHVLGEGLATTGRIRKATLMFRNVVTTAVSVLFY